MRALLLSLAVAVAACGGELEPADVCERLEDECTASLPYEECVDEGNVLREEAEDAGCDAEWTGYLACLDEAVCDWREGCEDAFYDLERCVTAR